MVQAQDEAVPATSSPAVSGTRYVDPTVVCRRNILPYLLITRSPEPEDDIICELTRDSIPIIIL